MSDDTDTSALLEVTEQLQARRRFVTPVIKDLDTGAVYTAAELDKIPKPTLSDEMVKDARRFDVGEVISKPFLALIPASWHPNHITFLNHICNWMLLTLTFSAHYLKLSYPEYTSFLYIVCAILNFACMTLDCLDGMHARKTKQCSKLGEFLDHWLDALHVPMVAGGISFALNFTETARASILLLNCILYVSQLIVYHYLRVFYQTGGVEGQILTSFLYIWCSMEIRYDFSPETSKLFGTLVSITAAIVSAHMIYQFIKRFDRQMWWALFLFLVPACGISALYLLGHYSFFMCTLLVSCISFRITGSYVLYSILGRPYNGWDWSLTIGVALLVWSCTIMSPLPVTTWYGQIIPPLKTWTDSLLITVNATSADGWLAWVITFFQQHVLASTISIQRVIPFFFGTYVLVVQLKTLEENYLLLKHL